MVCRSPPTFLTHSPWAAHVALLRVNLYANGSASCPLSAGARVGFPHSWRLTPPLLCLVSPFNSSLPSGDRGYLSKPVASFLFVQYQSADTVFFNKCQQVPLLFRNLHVSHNKSGFSYTIRACQRGGKDRTSHICAWITEGFNNIITDLLTWLIFINGWHVQESD